MLQSPFSLLCQELVSKQGENSIRFYILFLLGFMSGLEAGSGSRLGTGLGMDTGAWWWQGLRYSGLGWLAAPVPTIIATLDSVCRFCHGSVVLSLI